MDDALVGSCGKLFLMICIVIPAYLTNLQTLLTLLTYKTVCHQCQALYLELTESISSSLGLGLDLGIELD